MERFCQISVSWKYLKLSRGFQNRGRKSVVLVLALKGDVSGWYIDYPVNWFPRVLPILLLYELLLMKFDFR